MGTNLQLNSACGSHVVAVAEGRAVHLSITRSADRSRAQAWLSAAEAREASKVLGELADEIDTAKGGP
jgi:hypothetical protein